MHYIISYLDSLYSLTSEMAPYLLLGFLFAGILKYSVSPNIMTKYLGKNRLSSVINASLLGVPLPLCSCGVLPAGISLYKNGASKGSAVSFLISTPQTGVDSILVTWSMLGLPFALLRPIIAFVTGIVGGWFTNKVDNSDSKVRKDTASNTKPKFSIKGLLHYSFIEMVGDIAKWLVIGLLIAAFITVIIPDNFFTEYKLDGIVGMLIILAVSIPLYICATSSVPIAAVLLLKGLSPGALLVFLMAGPATNAATITVIGKNLGKKTLTVYLATLVIGSLVFGLLIDNFLPGSWFSPLSIINDMHGNHLLPQWLVFSSTLLLVLLIAYSYYNSAAAVYKKWNKSKQPPTYSIVTQELVVNVSGMTCGKCKAKVEDGIGELLNVSSAVADTENDTLKIVGNNLSPDDIAKKIVALGYKYNGVNLKD